MVQNADDAGASEFEIEFKCDGNQKAKALSFINNGMPFNNDDWSRLKRIAEGNPDENKVLSPSLINVFLWIDRILWSGIL